MKESNQVVNNKRGFERLESNWIRYPDPVYVATSVLPKERFTITGLTSSRLRSCATGSQFECLSCTATIINWIYNSLYR